MVKYCQKCGNAGYDNAQVCGNCGAKFPPKSKENSKPPVTTKSNDFKKGGSKTKKSNDFNFSEKLNNITNSLSNKVENIDLAKYSSVSNESKKQRVNQADVNKTSFTDPHNKTSFNQATSGFREKGRASKDPARKFNSNKDSLKTTESSTLAALGFKKGEIKEKSTTKVGEIGFKGNNKSSKDPARKFSNSNQDKNDKNPIDHFSVTTIGFKESSSKTKDPARKFNNQPKNLKPKKSEFSMPKIQKPKFNLSKNEDKRKLAIFGIIAIIIIAIAAIGISGLTNNTPTNTTETYTDGSISFKYPGNWSQYNNSESDSSAGEVAFRTPDNLIIGYSTIDSNDITLKDVKNDINDTAANLGGKIIKNKTIKINGTNASDITISTKDHGYSRYISIIKDDVYYNFIINNGRSSNSNENGLYTPEIENLINSIHFVK